DFNGVGIGAGIYYYGIYDHTGTVRSVVKRDASGNAEVDEWSDYYPWGMVQPGRNGVSSADYDHGYQGQFTEHDEETGWDAFELRMYDSRIARWTSADPAGQYHSPYLAMGNNPISTIDPDGAWGHWTGVLAGAVVGAGVGAGIAAATGGDVKTGAIAGGLLGAAYGLTMTQGHILKHKSGGTFKPQAGKIYLFEPQFGQWTGLSNFGSLFGSNPNRTARLGATITKEAVNAIRHTQQNQTTNFDNVINDDIKSIRNIRARIGGSGTTFQSWGSSDGGWNRLWSLRLERNTWASGTEIGMGLLPDPFSGGSGGTFFQRNVGSIRTQFTGGPQDVTYSIKYRTYSSTARKYGNFISRILYGY
ncbi:MAG: RHS repeat-associated core domain-containing protein, partial [Vicingaceae bacterium]